MTMAARDAAIAKFTKDPNCKVFRMSLKAGGVALNLTVASHVRFPIVFYMSSDIVLPMVIDLLPFMHL